MVAEGGWRLGRSGRASPDPREGRPKTMEFVEVGTVTTWTDGQMVGFEVDDRRILLAKVEGEFFAIGATCTHERSNLDQGALLGHVVYCPLHFSAFDVRSGAVLGPPAECPVPEHEVRVEDGRVLVCTQPWSVTEPPPPDAAAAVPASPGAAATGAAVAQETAPEPAPERHPNPSPPPSPTDRGTGTCRRRRRPAATGAAERWPSWSTRLTELRGELAQATETVRESSGELAERVARLEQTVQELRTELAAAKPAQAGAGGGDPWNHQAPRFMSRIPTSVRYLPLAIAIPAGIVALLVLTSAVVLRGRPCRPGRRHPVRALHRSWLARRLRPVRGGCRRRAGRHRSPAPLEGAAGNGPRRSPPPARSAGALRGTAEEVIKHDGFESWTVTDVQRRFHLKIFYGFLGLLAATTGAAIYTEIFPILGIDWHDNELSLPIWDPVKIVGNVGGIALLIGLTQVMLTWRRRSSDRATYSDWFFPDSARAHRPLRVRRRDPALRRCPPGLSGLRRPSRVRLRIVRQFPVLEVRARHVLPGGLHVRPSDRGEEKGGFLAWRPPLSSSTIDDRGLVSGRSAGQGGWK